MAGKRGFRYKGFLRIGVLLVAVLLSIPLWHIKEIRGAQERYELQALAIELAWVEKWSPWLKKIPLVRDSELWLKLNQGKLAEVADLIADPKDDKERFWLFQIRLAENRDQEARSLAKSLEKDSLSKLAEGLLAYKQGQLAKARQDLLTGESMGLSREGRVMALTGLARVAMAQGHWDQAVVHLQDAKGLLPQYPLVMITEFDYLLAKEEWERAKNLAVALEALPGYGNRPDYLIRKALLALIENNPESWKQILAQLSKQEKGRSYQEYLLGIEAYQRNQLNAAAARLKKSLELDLPQPFRQDAQTALAQAAERLAAQPKLEAATKHP